MKDRSIFFTAILILALGILAIEALSRQREVPLKRPLKGVPLILDSWRGRDSKLQMRTIDILGVDDYISRVYTKGDLSIWVYVGYYASQKKGALIHSPRHCYPAAGWQIIKMTKDAIEIPSKKIVVNRLLLKKGEEEKLVFYWYIERGRIITNEYKAKFYLIFDRIFRQRSNGALIEFSAPVIYSIDNTARIEKDFIRVFYPILEKFFRGG